MEEGGRVRRGTRALLPVSDESAGYRGLGAGRTIVRVGKDHQGVDVVDPFDPEAAFVVFEIAKDGLDVSRLQPRYQRRDTS